MPAARSLALSLAAVLVAVTLSACATTINHVLADPGRYRDRTVTVSGRVADSVSVGGHGAYRLEDRSGSLWVVSAAGVPRTGAHVKVKGRVHDAFNVGLLGGRLRLPEHIASGVVLEERSHKAD
ncbi:MAG: hypothetical protein IT184_17250 [Acidobacteria bacterium]|nr:hypothetical protein [Acidobacteriota bacterium]